MGAKHGAVFALMVQFFLRAGVIAVQTFGRLQICHGAELKLWAAERIRVLLAAGFI